MTDQIERSEAKGKDLLGLFLCGIGGLFFVSVLLSFGERAPKEVVWTAPVVGLIDAIGRGAALVLTGAVAGLGTALFLGKRDIAIGRYLAGFAGVTLGLSLLIGGVVPTGDEGGLLGSVLPDLLPGIAGRLTGAILGLGIVAASAYFTWLLPVAAAAAQSLAPSLEARSGSEGVSAAEADALTPATPPTEDRPVAPSSPYPSDARLEGRIPRGTQPLEPGGAVPPPPAREERREDETPVKQEGWQRVVPTRAEREQEARPPLGGGGPALVDVQPLETAGNSPLTPSWERSPAPVPSEPWEEPRVVPLAAAAPVAETTPPAPEANIQPPVVPVLEDVPPPAGFEGPEPEFEAEAEDTAEATVGVESTAEESPPQAEATARQGVPPAWEQVGLFDDQEPETAGVSAPEEQASEPVEAALEETEEDPQAREEGEDEEQGLYPEEGEDDEEEYEEEDEDEELVASDEDDEEEDEEEYEEEDEDEELVASDEDDEEEDEEEYEEEDEDAELVASDEDDEEEDEEEYEEEDEEEDEDAELVASDEDDEEEDEEEYEEEDEDEELAASAEDEPQEEAASVAEAEPEKVLEPAQAPAAEDPAPLAPAADFETLVHQAGCLVIEQNRVAVSMLQRSFQLDFDQACAVLDQLQERGLIGPYMGGRTRDILLTREEWLVQAPVA